MIQTVNLILSFGARPRTRMTICSFVDLTKWLNKKDAVKGKRRAAPSPSIEKKVAVKEKRKMEKKVASEPSSESSEEEQEKEKAKKDKKKSSE